MRYAIQNNVGKLLGFVWWDEEALLWHVGDVWDQIAGDIQPSASFMRQSDAVLWCVNCHMVPSKIFKV